MERTSRRRRAGALVAAAATAAALDAASAPARVPVYAGEPAWGRAFAEGADSVTTRRLVIARAVADSLRARVGVPAVDSVYVFREAWRGGRVVRRAVEANVRGQYEPITFVVVLDGRGAVARVEVTAYRESRGGEVRRRAFLRQFEGATAASPPRLGHGIRHVTGATVSSRAVTRGVRLVLELLRRLDRTGDGRAPARGEVRR